MGYPAHRLPSHLSQGIQPIMLWTDQQRLRQVFPHTAVAGGLVYSHAICRFPQHGIPAIIDHLFSYFTLKSPKDMSKRCK